MSSSRDRRLTAAAASVVAALGIAGIAKAAPYAAQITTSGGNVTFRLSENADDVTIIRTGGTSPGSQSLGAQTAGAITFAANGATSYKIVASKTSGPGYLTATAANVGTALQTSNDNDQWMQYERITGIAANTNPKTPSLFGRVYVAAPRDALTAGLRQTGEGIYIHNADTSLTFPEQNDATNNIGTGFKAGLDSFFAGGGNSSPYRLALDKDGSLYIADWADATGTVYRTSPDVGNSGGTNLLTGQGSTVEIAPSASLNHGSVAGMVLTGATSTGDLQMYTVDEDLSPNGNATQLNSIWHYNIGATTSGYAGIPDQVAHDILLSNVQGGGIVCDIARGPDGKFYMSQNRSVGSELGLAVVSPTGQKIYDSLADTIARGLDGDTATAGTQDLFRRAEGIDISPDGQYLAIATNNAGDTWIVPLLDGIPDMPNALLIDTFTGSTSTEAAFDAAGNLWVGNNSSELLRRFSPGGVSQTVYDSAGGGAFTYRIDPEWNVAGGGNYSTGGNWLLNAVPNAQGATAKFGTQATGATAVTIDAPVTLGTIKFDGTNSYTLSGANTITLSSFGEPRVTVLGGSHTISAPVTTAQNIQFTVANGSTLTVSNFTETNAAASITTAGSGVTALNNYRAATLNVKSGTAKVISNGNNSGTSVVKNLNIAGATDAWAATLDLTNNNLIVDWDPAGTSPLATIQNQIKSGSNNGVWNGTGITSSAAAAAALQTHKTTLIAAEASALGLTSFAGQPVDTSAVVVRYAYFGDANIDGRVNSFDFAALATSFGTSGQDWFHGDFNNDGIVNAFDFSILATNFGFSLPSGPAGGLGAAVPEPASLGLLGIAASAAMLRGRRRRRA